MKRNDEPVVAAGPEVVTRRTLQGAVVNLVGLLARFVRPLFWIAATRLYGPSRIGEFAIAVSLLELTRQFTSSGVADAVTMFLSQDIGRDGKEERLYKTLANAFWFIIFSGGVIIAFVFLGGHLWVASLTHREMLVDWAPVLVWGIPVLALAEMLVAATRAHMVMKWHAIILGILQPSLQLLFVVLFYVLGFEQEGLAWGWLAGVVGTSLAALVVFSRYFNPIKLVSRLPRPGWHGKMMSFVWPQNLNMTFGYFVTNLDLLMLGVLGVPSAQIAFYFAGIQLTRNLRSIKVAFGSSFGPVIARFSVDRRTDELNIMFQRMSRLALSLVLPVALVVGTLRADLLLLFDSGFTWDSRFVLLLLVVQVLVSGLGLSGNLVVMSGFVGWNLFNSVVAAALNLVLNIWLIPIYGLWGAALATLLAAVLNQTLMALQIRWLLNVRIAPLQLAGPLAAALCALALWAIIPSGNSVGLRVLATATVLVSYAGMWWMFGKKNRGGMPASLRQKLGGRIRRRKYRIEKKE